VQRLEEAIASEFAWVRLAAFVVDGDIEEADEGRGGCFYGYEEVYKMFDSALGEMTKSLNEACLADFFKSLDALLLTIAQDMRAGFRRILPDTGGKNVKSKLSVFEKK